MTTQHPKRETWQRWRCEYDGFTEEETIVGAEECHDGLHYKMSNGSLWSHQRWNGMADWGTCFTMTLLSPSASPASEPDRSKCKAWCGKPYGTPGLPTEFADSLGRRGCWPLELGELRVARPKESLHDPAWCSPACRDARVPPLKSKPAETGKCAHGYSGYCVHCAMAKGKSPPAQEAPNPLPFSFTDDEGREHRFATGIERDNASRAYLTKRKPSAQEAPKVPICLECDKTAPNVCWRVTRNGREILCDICMTRQEEQVHDLMIFERSGKPYAGPERLPKAKLAHVAGLSGDELVKW